MIYFGYFNSALVRNTKRKVYSIALHQFIPVPKAEELLLNPSDFKMYRQKLIDLDILKKLYRTNVLDKLSANEIYNKYDECILLCHEVKGCHREEVILWLNENGFPAKEYGGE